MRDRLLWLGVLISLVLAAQVFDVEYREMGPHQPVKRLAGFDLCRGYLTVWPEARPDTESP